MKNATNAIKPSDFKIVAEMISSGKFDSSKIDTSMLKNADAYLKMIETTVNKYSKLRSGELTPEKITKDAMISYLYNYGAGNLKTVNAKDTTEDNKIPEKFDSNDDKKPYNYLEELQKFYKQMEVTGVDKKSIKYYEEFISFLTGASQKIMDDYGTGSSLLNDVKGKLSNSQNSLLAKQVQEKIDAINKKEADFAQSETSKGVDKTLEPFLVSYKTVLENSIEEIIKLENVSQKYKDDLIKPIKDRLDKTNSDLNKINSDKVTNEIVDKVNDFLKAADLESIDKSSKEFLEEYQRTLETAIGSFGSLDNLTENQKNILVDYQNKLAKTKTDISSINSAEEAKKIEEQLLSQYISAFDGQKEFLAKAAQMNLNPNSASYKAEWNDVLNKQIESLLKVYTDPKVSEDIKIATENAIKIAEKNLYPTKETTSELTDKQKDLNSTMSATISLVNQLGNTLGSDLINSLANVMSSIQSIINLSQQMTIYQVTAGVSGISSAAGTLGKVGAGIAIAGTVYGVLDGISSKGDAEAQAETERANEIYQSQLDALAAIQENTASLNDTFKDLRSTLVDLVSDLPTTSNMNTGQNLIDYAYQALNSQRDFGGITTKWNENQDYWDVYKWKNRNREQAYTFSESDVGNLLGVNFDTASIDQLKDAYNKINSQMFYNATTGLGEHDGSMFEKDWNFGYFTGDTSAQFKETLGEYIAMLEEAQRQAEAFERTVKLSSMTGIQVLDAEQEKANMIELYKNLGITITNDIEKEIENLVSEMGDFSVTIMSDIRSSIIENGGDVAEAMKTYVDAMVNNAFTKIVDSMLGQDFDKLSKMFGELVNLQIAGGNTTEKRIEIAQAMLDTIRKQDALVDAKTDEVNKLIQALRDLGAKEEEIAALGLLDDSITEEMEKLASNIEDMISSALTEGIDDGFNVDTFSSKLGESIYNSVKESMIAAMTASMNTKIIEKIMNSYDFDKMFEGMNISEMMTAGQNVMNDITSQLEANGLDFGNTSGTTGADTISNSVGLQVDTETAGASIVYHNYNYNPYYAGDVLYGDNASETALFEKFDNYMKNKNRSY